MTADDIISNVVARHVVMTSGCGSVWLERYLREVEAASSNLVTPTAMGVRRASKIKA